MSYQGLSDVEYIDIENCTDDDVDDDDDESFIWS